MEDIKRSAEQNEQMRRMQQMMPKRKNLYVPDKDGNIMGMLQLQNIQGFFNEDGNLTIIPNNGMPYKTTLNYNIGALVILHELDPENFPVNQAKAEAKAEAVEQEVETVIPENV